MAEMMLAKVLIGMIETKLCRDKSPITSNVHLQAFVCEVIDNKRLVLEDGSGYIVATFEQLNFPVSRGMLLSVIGELSSEGGGGSTGAVGPTTTKTTACSSVGVSVWICINLSNQPNRESLWLLEVMEFWLTRKEALVTTLLGE